ncbi:TPA: MFS transporter [Klebsiella pneumoniae]|uniref:MFS transporter n=1 Tax=Enterobacteriaceae TaxID=543 RepID=UPI0006830191|nr:MULTISPECIES: MFS transporter [Enterobacteriaceae]HDH1516870.1 MFS transporter [Klebsiella quasipneumoniae subsp. similipneumoniae]MCA2027654.1 MFS transporter [Enterobacter sp. K16B]SSJ85827.1 putative drug efflux protein [Klebsiella pneumoniae]SSK66309.1 putative drug efflux protein [Klebsiella pneumoniae]HBR4643508.1 MFS transporter [Klebsiella pneumoniae]
MSEQTLSEQRERIRPPMGLFPAMLALGAGGLCIGTGEFAPMSLLPDLAQGTGVSIPAAGGYISAYAAGVVVGAPAIAVLGARLARKTLLLILLIIALAGYALSAVASGYNAMLAARFISGMPHGAWYGVSALVAASMVSPQHKARYIGYVMLGLAVANVAGVPLVTWAGQALGWKMSFWMVTTGLVLTAILVLLFVPSVAADRSASPLKELGALKSPRILMTFAVASVSFAGMFAVYSFITPALTEAAGFSASSVPWILVLWGAGMVAGNIIGGRLADIALIPSIFGIIVWNIVFLGLFSLTGTLQIPVLIVLFMLGCGFSLVPALQAHMMNIAGDAQTLASSLTHSAFNISNALGAAAGGFVIASGGSWISTGWVGATFSLLALLLMFISVRITDGSNHER